MHKFERYCDDIENVENYEVAKKDNFVDWDCHHRLETHTSDGERRLVDITREELKALNTYYHRPAEELIFMKVAEHTSLHKRGKPKSEGTRRKLAEANKGKKHSEETKRKMSEALKGRTLSEEHRKHLSEGKKGKNNPMYGKTPWNKGKHK